MKLEPANVASRPVTDRLADAVVDGRKLPDTVAESSIEQAVEVEPVNDNATFMQLVNDTVACCGEFICMLSECVSDFVHFLFYNREEKKVAAFVRKWQCHFIPSEQGAEFDEVRAEWVRDFEAIGPSAQTFVLRHFANRSYDKETANKLCDDQSVLKLTIFCNPGDPVVLVGFMSWLKASADERVPERAAQTKMQAFLQNLISQAAQGKLQQVSAAEIYTAMPEEGKAATRQLVSSHFPELFPHDPSASTAVLDEIVCTILEDPSSEELLSEVAMQHPAFASLMDSESTSQQLSLGGEKFFEGKRRT